MNDRRPPVPREAAGRSFLGLGFAGAIVFALGLQAVAGAQAPPPPPVPNPSATPLALPTAQLVTPSPTPSPTPAPRRGRRGAPASPAATSAPGATPTPTSPAFSTLDGTWEVQLQYMDHTAYSYFVLQQKDTVLSGVWRADGKQAYPITGTYDGRLIRFVAKAPSGDVTFAGYVENGSDMVGEAEWPKNNEVPFTAEHRGPPPKGILHPY